MSELPDPLAEAAAGIADDHPRDPLTGLPGMDVARQRLGEWVEGGAQATDHDSGGRVHVLLLGLRRFEAVNLAYGEAVGDGALIEIAGRIARFAGAELDCPWMAARGPGGTFFLMADEACSRERWQMFAEQLADRVARPIAGRHGNIRLTPRVALLRVLVGEGPESALDRLAQTMAVVNGQTARRVMWCDGETMRAGRTAAQLEADLLRAIDKGEIEVLFQPQFALAPDGSEYLSGAEALARWNHPKLGRIGAGALFAIAERADHDVPLSRHICETALKAAAAWPAPLRLSINVTAADLASGGFTFDLGIALGKTGFPTGRLTLEVTEQVLVADIGLAERSLSDLSRLGIRIALDDFGAGFCNFRYLKALPLDYLKLDRSMVDGITEDARDLAVFRGIVAMAHALDLSVIAEGIETEAQRMAVAREGAGCYQGFVRAQPMAAQDFLALAQRATA
ncbi:EAL domain-containing protein [Novosphingobium sp. FSY-8]|uniref:EAL domain-containing protein n=1 Tax=Novosphingobium ovatum TaxID=1908523 RepID=A0ABW9XA42_9SPHN|nr:bifunctional diguanylate cyclase/phosphodiesterase [Novosphingobium ovatum]NBC35394.1 EAL domain-containing protein [Novosphingobium ovatum]